MNEETPVADAIARYHDLLDGAVGEDSHAQLNFLLHRRELFFGARPVCTVLRPRFLSGDQYRAVQSAVRRVMPAFSKVHEAAVADPAIRRKLGLAPWEERLLMAEPGGVDPSPTSRMDTFLTGTGSLYLTEYNAETPAGAGYNDALSDVFATLPVMRRFEREYEVIPLPAQHHVLHALLDAYQRQGGRHRPTIAIVDWRDVPTYSEFVIFRDYFAWHGFECIIADPREFEYRDGRLLADGSLPIDVVYKRVLLTELVLRCGEDHAIVRAVQDRAVCMVNAFACKPLHKKAGLAILSDELHADLFTSDERHAIDAYIPWTRVLDERTTECGGERVDMLPFLAATKDRFVLKPNDDYGGTGIVLGWEVTQGDWEQALKERLDVPTIVQERVPIPSEPYPSFVDGRVEVVDRMLDTNPYIWHGAYVSGCLTRLSTAALLNVTAGGGSTVPTFVIEKRG